MDFRGRPLTFEGIMGDFRKKVLQTDFERKKQGNKFLGEKYPALKKNIAHDVQCCIKILHRYMLRKKFLTPEWFGKRILPIQTKSVKSPIPHSPTNVQWSCQPFMGRRKKRIWHFSKCHPSTKWLARVHHVVVFKTKVLHFKIENTPIKDTNGKRKFKRMLSFLFVDKRKLFAMKLSFEEFNLVFYTADRSAWLVLNQPRQRGFWRHLRYIPYSMIKEKCVFKKEFLYL